LVHRSDFEVRPHAEGKPAPVTRFEPRSQLRVEFKTELGELPPLAARWEALNRRLSDHDAPFFQSYAWNHHVARIRARCSPDHFKIHVATVWRGDDLVGVWPLGLQRSAGTWIAHSLDDPFGQLAGVAFHDRADVAPGVAAILSELSKHADGLQIEATIAGSALHAALSSRGATAASAAQGVFVDLRPYPTFQAFEQTIKSSTRKVLRKRAEKLRQAHQVERTVVDDGARIRPLLDEVFETRLQWLQQNGRTSPAFRDDAFKPLIAELADAPGIEVLGFSLANGQASIAAQLGFGYAGKFYGYMTSKNPAFDEFSPGRQLYRLVLEGCFDRGLKVLELMAPASDDKLEWNGEIRQIETMIMPFSARGRLALQLTHWLMPAARRVSRMLPEAVRKPLIRRLNRT
jgi:CelD/BcsL family acetyltransferase involved in cellulose biosynthesis